MKINREWIKNILIKKIENHEGNLMELQSSGEKYYQKPLVGFIRGDDDIFLKFKEVIGPGHLTPLEIITWQAERIGKPVPAAHEITVVSYVLPLNKNTILENASNSEWLSPRWAQTRLFGENFNQLLAREIVEELMNNNVLAVAPEQSPLFKRDKIEGIGITSTWSHRHMAYAAGLGTFGIHDFLITEKGATHRCGSFVINLVIPPLYERSPDIHANCLHYRGIKCLKCAARCPVHAIKISGHDKNKCSDRVQDSKHICRDQYGLDIYGCGLCSTKVPCESGIPEELRNAAPGNAS